MDIVALLVTLLVLGVVFSAFVWIMDAIGVVQPSRNIIFAILAVIVLTNAGLISGMPKLGIHF